MTHTLKDAVYGQAVADALGVPYEFQPRGTFHATTMTGHGTHNQPAGTWSDDTSMALAICDSIRSNKGRIDPDDMRERFNDWYQHGDYTIDGLFDIGNTTIKALRAGHGMTDDWDNGNGSLMRTIPLAFTDASETQVEQVSAITHANPTSTRACVKLIHYARELIEGRTPIEAIREAGYTPALADEPENAIRSGGYVLDTLKAAVWCLITTDNYADCALKAVNLGDDTDTTAAVAGGLAGIVYGTEGIPAEWIAKLRGRDVIDACLFA